MPPASIVWSRGRSAICAFLATPVPREILNAALETPQHAPSNSNIQPWRVAIVAGRTRDTLATTLTAYAREHGLARMDIPGRSRYWSEVLAPFIKALNAVPRIVLASLFIIWFGLGLSSKVATVVVLVFFAVFFNAFIVQKLVTSFVQTLRWIKLHSPAQIADNMPPQYAGANKDPYLQSIVDSIGMFSGDGIMKSDGAQNALRILGMYSKNVAPVKQRIDINATYTTEFARAALRD
ncbi:nitroreductase family protein [Mycobacterium sp. D16R24]|uniref:nitroreductase family protein n=1 Tax=Mycobacterium sp. D16R24 TaxID=1855656 RepID=UPI000991A92D|nr:nitroreductase family protein [Mycobacterium sp. D16R24]